MAQVNLTEQEINFILDCISFSTNIGNVEDFKDNFGRILIKEDELKNKLLDKLWNGR